MSYQVYPGINVIRGLTWKITRTPQWDTLAQRMSSGKEFRLSYYQYPLWKWELEYNYLLDNPNNLVSGNVDTDLVILQGFFNQMAGQFQVFLFDDVNLGDQPGAGPWDSVAGQGFGTGDGTTTTFQLIRTSGGFTEAIQAPYTVPEPQVYDNGAAKSYGTDYSVDAFGNVIFAVAPLAGHALTADFGYYWPVRFGSDELDFETQLYQLWKLKKVTLQQVRL